MWGLCQTGISFKKSYQRPIVSDRIFPYCSFYALSFLCPSSCGRTHSFSGFAAIKGNAMHIVGTLFWLWPCLIFICAQPALVHSKSEAWKRCPAKLDHVMIYIMIAATYTPVSFYSLIEPGMEPIWCNMGLGLFASTLRWTGACFSFYVTWTVCRPIDFGYRRLSMKFMAF